MKAGDDTLRAAMEAPENNVVTVLNELCATPETARLSREHGGVIRSPLPNDGDRTASFSVFPAPDGAVLLFKRHGGEQVGNVFSLLLLLGYSRRRAADYLLGRAGQPRSGSTARVPASAYRPPSPLERARAKAERFAPVDDTDRIFLERAQQDLVARWPVRALEARGLDLSTARLAGLGLTPDGWLVVPVPGPDGTALALKLRRPDPLPDGASRYVYRGTGHGTPALCSPGYGVAPFALVCEGELNALAAWSAMSGLWDAQGVAGTSGSPHADALKDRQVLVYADGDEAGLKARARWAELAAEAGAASVRLLEPLPLPDDFCDLAGRDGVDALRERLGRLSRDGRGPDVTARPDVAVPTGARAGSLRSRVFRRFQGLP